MKARVIDEKQGWEGKVTQNKDGQTEVQTKDQTQIAHTSTSEEIARDPERGKRAAEEMSNRLDALDRNRSERPDVAQQVAQQQDQQMEESRDVGVDEIGSTAREYSQAFSGSM